jgi:light-regulated signal transduction histidine kinase (bacteriophytochrome)
MHAKELAISNKELEQFAYIASHDLQEPLRMVSSFLTQLEKKYGNALDDKAHQYIHFAVDGAKRMRQIILDLLDYSRIGKNEGERELISLNQVLEEVLALHRKTIEEKGAQINIAEMPRITAFRGPILQVFHNIIGNAIKYVKDHESPVIEIKAKQIENYLEVAIKDNGIGIDPEYFEKIFIIFQRLHNNEKYGGTGMGLAIVKKIMENMEGSVRVESTLGQGSIFYLLIPIK